MTEGDGPAMGIDTVERESPDVKIHARFLTPISRIRSGFEVGNQLRRERLVDLPQVDVLGAQLVPREQARNRARRSHQHPVDAEIHGGHVPVEELDRRRDIESSQPNLVCDPDRGGAVGER